MPSTALNATSTCAAPDWMTPVTWSRGHVVTQERTLSAKFPKGVSKARRSAAPAGRPEGFPCGW